ncbi:hypothetical protein ACFYW6_39905 [Streptomyces sp. NPDC002659]|uniref:hypothetical protein n=1 Tax=Streptomyces sp. NPDC002659 TaxID=3364656 RepID=UPI0036D1F21A
MGVLDGMGRARQTNADHVELHLMPGCSPEPDPDELLNADVKRHVHPCRARSTDNLAHETVASSTIANANQTSSVATSRPDHVGNSIVPAQAHDTTESGAEVFSHAAVNEL